jgi:hypothetical protein
VRIQLKMANTQQMTPLDWMLGVVNDETASKERRDKMAAAAAPFVHARISPDRSYGNGATHEMRVNDLSKLSDEELDQLERIARKLAGAYGDPDLDAQVQCGG